ncbi:hypothetical protein Q427_19660 [Halomonas sp. BC04]|nr:hypothetical protein Q427_19660 [Halomonas sp. BC04]
MSRLRSTVVDRGGEGNNCDEHPLAIRVAVD